MREDAVRPLHSGCVPVRPEVRAGAIIRSSLDMPRPNDRDTDEQRVALHRHLWRTADDHRAIRGWARCQDNVTVSLASRRALRVKLRVYRCLGSARAKDGSIIVRKLQPFDSGRCAGVMCREERGSR